MKERILLPEELTALKKGFGENVRKSMHQLNLSQEDLGFECGLQKDRLCWIIPAISSQLRKICIK